MRKSAIEQIKLEAKAEAFTLAAKYSQGFAGQSGKEVLDQMAQTSKQNLEEHIRIHGEYVA